MQVRRRRVGRRFEIRRAKERGKTRRRDVGRQHCRQQRRRLDHVNVVTPFERQPVAVSRFRLRGVLAGSLTLPGFVAAILLLTRKHEKLFAGDTAAPQERGHDKKRQHRTGNTS